MVFIDTITAQTGDRVPAAANKWWHFSSQFHFIIIFGIFASKQTNKLALDWLKCFVGSSGYQGKTEAVAFPSFFSSHGVWQFGGAHEDIQGMPQTLFELYYLLLCFSSQLVEV